MPVCADPLVVVDQCRVAQGNEAPHSLEAVRGLAERRGFSPLRASYSLPAVRSRIAEQPRPMHKSLYPRRFFRTSTLQDPLLADQRVTLISTPAGLLSDSVQPHSAPLPTPPPHQRPGMSGRA